MAAGILPSPGTELGPCSDPCPHSDCRVTRQQSEHICRWCWKPIGYGTRFYQVAPDALVHASCEEDAHENQIDLVEHTWTMILSSPKKVRRNLAELLRSGVVDLGAQGVEFDPLLAMQTLGLAYRRGRARTSAVGWACSEAYVLGLSESPIDLRLTDLGRRVAEYGHRLEQPSQDPTP